MSEKKSLIKLDFSFFEKNGKIDFVKIINKNKEKTSQAFSLFIIGVRNEANGSKESSRIIYKYASTQKITKEEERHLKTQFYDLFKIMGIGIPFVLIPGATLLIPFILKAAEKKGVDLYPSNFNGKKEVESSVKSKE